MWTSSKALMYRIRKSLALLKMLSVSTKKIQTGVLRSGKYAVFLSGNLTKKKCPTSLFCPSPSNGPGSKHFSLTLYHTGFSFWFSGTLSLILWLGVPVLPTVPLPVPLSHHQRCHHGNQHSDGDDEHGGGFSDAELAVHPGQRGPHQLRRVLARDIPVVVNVEVADVQDLTEDAMQIAVAAPWVSWRRQQRGVKEERWGKIESEKSTKEELFMFDYVYNMVPVITSIS